MTDKEKQQIEEIRVEIWHGNTTLSDVCYYIIRKQQEVRKETAKEILKELYDETEGMNNKTVELSAHYIKNTLAKAYGVKL